MPDAPRSLSTKDRDRIADYIRREKRDRKSAREGLEDQWREVDRQIAMKPKASRITSGTENDWYPDVEEPLQYNALEVTLADYSDMIFPPGTEWFTVLSHLSDEYLERFNRRRRTNPLIGSEVVRDAGGRTVVPNLDQEGADAFVKGTLDWFHKLHDFRGKLNLMLCEQIKYGVGVTRVLDAIVPKFSHEFRGVKSDSIRGPVLAPSSIWNVFPDDSPTFTLHEGVATSPTTIKASMQLLEDLKNAAAVGGPDRGWMMREINKLEPLNKDNERGFVETLEAEGDIIVPKSQGSIFLPNVLVTVARGADGTKMVRYRPNPRPFRSYVFAHYLRDKVRSPYGGSPLLKGHTLQEVATFTLNDLLASGRLNVLPPTSYDRSDAKFAAEGGPRIHPSAKWETDAPDAINVHQIGDPGALLNAYAAMLKKYEDLTGANDPRRGASIRSHTGTGAHELQAIRGFARTQNVANDFATGPMISILNMEYDIIKSVLTRKMAIPIDRVGIEGWVELQKDDLPDEVSFRVHGAAGVATQREKVANFMAATNAAVQLMTTAAQLQIPINLDFNALITEIFQNAGINNVAKFLRQADARGQPAAQIPAEGGQARQISLERDADGRLSGATVVPFPG